MIDQVLSILVSAVEAVISWWSKVMTGTGAGTLYLVIMCVVLSVGILLKPVIGNLSKGLSSAGSDFARKVDPSNRKVK